MSNPQTLGFIGLGVMGGPMCRNLARKSGSKVVAFDTDQEALRVVTEDGAVALDGVAAVIRESEVVFLCLPGEPQVREVCEGPGGILATCRSGQTIVDSTTAPVTLSRELGAKFAEKGVAFADAPVARGRQAAIDGTLSITVGAAADLFPRIEPLLEYMATDVTHCGEVGAGHAVKLMNQLVLTQNVVAVCEALAIATKAGFDGAMLFDALSKGSADSFGLRNHGIKAVLPGVFPEKSFSTKYMLKDIGYALDLAKTGGVKVSGAEHVRKLLQETIKAGFDEVYWPVIKNVIDK